MKKNDFFIIINMIHYQHIVFVTGSTLEKGTPLKYKFKMPIYKPSKN